MDINVIGMLTLTKREIWRFMKVWNQTLVAPMITALLFLAVLTLALGGDHRTIEGMPLPVFIAPGLIMMTIVQNAFANTSSSLMLMKIQGVIIDVLMPPLSPAEITCSFVAGGVVRGVLVGIVVGAGVYLFVPFAPHDLLLAVLITVLSSIMMALLGVLAGVWSQSFDHLAAITGYIVTPLAFLSGTFYSIRALPEFWYHLSHYNPFFYMIDGFRYALIGYSDSSVMLGISVLVGTNIVLWASIQIMISRGYRLKT